MRVYVLSWIHNTDSEFNNIYGVYSSLELAQQDMIKSSTLHHTPINYERYDNLEWSYFTDYGTWRIECFVIDNKNIIETQC